MKNSFKKLSLFSLVNVLGWTISIDAALPPFYQSVNEYRSLLNDKQLEKALVSAEGIREIKRTENGFTIISNKHTLDVELIYDSQAMPGPANFHFIFHDAIKINGSEK